uniref:Uncharacterized protein n=1 Tax=Ditylenchus dipsaci TaxID=166011 RepID=A0A915CX78_9BILA
MAKRASSDIRGFFKQPKRDDQMVPEQHLDEEISDEERELQLSDDDCLQRYPAEMTEGGIQTILDGQASPPPNTLIVVKTAPHFHLADRAHRACSHHTDEVWLELVRAS